MSEFSVVPGEVLAGKYRVDRVLGQGGMGIVVAATHLQLDERVALKFLLPGIASADATVRFIREARAAVRIKNEHVARVSDVGALENGAPYMVMEYLEGKDLSETLAERGRLTVDEVIDFVLQASEALAEAHSYGIVHRDLKPANLFVTRRYDGAAVVKVLDFGISKLIAGPADSSLTRTGGMLGSPLYMSPEQLTSARDVDARSDLWALGVIMYELLTGAAPFVAEELPQLCIAILQAEIRPIAQFRNDVPPAIDAAVMRCLARERNLRFQSIRELADALAPYASARSTRSVEEIRSLSGARSSVTTNPSITTNPSLPQIGVAPYATTQTVGEFAGTRGGEVKPKSAKPWIAAGVLIALATIGGVAALRFSGSKPADETSTPAAAAPPASPASTSAPVTKKENVPESAPSAPATVKSEKSEPVAAPTAPSAKPSAALKLQPPSVKSAAVKPKSAVDDRL